LLQDVETVALAVLQKAENDELGRALAKLACQELISMMACYASSPCYASYTFDQGDRS
jgi:hypothetical protein